MAADVTQQKQAEAALAVRLRQQAVVTQLSQFALSESNRQALFDRTTQLVAESLNVDYCKILELSPDGDSLLVRAGTGWHPNIVGQAVVSTDTNSQAGYTLQSQQPIVVIDLKTESRFQGPDLLTDHQVISGMSTIIQGQDQRPYGVLGAHSTRYRIFTQDDINFLQAIANLLSAAIRRHHTEAELCQLNETLEERIRDRTQALEAVNQELESFSYSIAHDLRAPLRAIQGFARVLQEDYGPALDHTGQKYISRITASAERLDMLILDLLTYSQLGRSEINLRRINIESVVTEILQELQPTLEAKQAEVEIVSALPVVRAHRSVLYQVFNNLINNALKFVAPGVKPKIQISAEDCHASFDADNEPTRQVRIWIQDNGIGIASHHQDRIFTPFERLHGIDAYPGTGIGLSIVQRGINRMGGKVGVDSIEGQGSRFWIDLKR
jgi:signal transduction histidine kinase